MSIPKKDLKIEVMRGKGPGGQHRNKTSSTVRITHKPTGISVTEDSRSQAQNKRAAMAELERRLREMKADARAEKKKARRDEKIHERDIIRTYDFKSSIVRDHRTRKRASIKDILSKGKLELLR